MTDNTDAPAMPVDVTRILEMLPHRYPFLLVDRVVACEPGKSLRAIKNVTMNEPFFQGHFPGHPIMPGVLVIEAMAQASGVLVHLSAETPKTAPLYYLVKVDKARFSRTVVPGDQLVMEINLKRMVRGMARFSCRTLVDGEQAACAEILCAERSER